MSYTPHTWVDNETITAAKLNNIETGVAGAGGGFDAVLWFPDSTQGWQVEGDFASAVAKIQDGKPLVCLSYGNTYISGSYMRMSEATLREFSYDSEYPNQIIINAGNSYSGWVWTANGVEWFYDD